jgi:cytidine deaminase
MSKDLVLFSQLTPEEKKQVRVARKALVAARVPQSNFRVGAALLAANAAWNGKIFPGCNTEYTAWGLVCCAERKALQKALDADHNRFICMTVTFAKMADSGMSPCGLCRAALAEYGGRDLRFNCVVNDKLSVLRWTLGEFLPERDVRKVSAFRDLLPADGELCAAVLAASKQSYNPYSPFQAAVAIRARNLKGEERIFTGGRFENASYGATTSPFEIAAGTAANQGFLTFETVATFPGEQAAEKTHRVFVHDGFVEVSGADLQVVRERGLKSRIINVAPSKEKVGIASLEAMLPYSFGPESLGLT